MEEYQGLTLEKLKQAINNYYYTKKPKMETKTLDQTVIDYLDTKAEQIKKEFQTKEGEMLGYDGQSTKWVAMPVDGIFYNKEGEIAIPNPTPQPSFKYEMPAYAPKQEAPKFYHSKEDNVFYRYDSKGDWWIISDNEVGTNNVSYRNAEICSLKKAIELFKNDFNTK